MKNLKFSIFLKLAILVIIFIVLVNLSLGFLIRFSSGKPPREFFGKPPHFIQEYVIREIGIPPDIEKVKSVSSELDLSMRIETTNIKWSNENSVPSIGELKNERGFRDDRPDFSVHYNGRPYFVSILKDGYIIFSPNVPRDYVNTEKAIISIIIIVTLLALLFYFSLRWIFGPIRELSEGVKRISRGDFEKDIEVNRKDELGNLAQSINFMKSEIAGMIKSKESLLVDVSHELRSPLTRLKLSTEFIEDKNIRDKMKDDIKEMEIMITELLETYRVNIKKGKDDFVKTDIVKLVKNEVSRAENETVNFRTDMEEKLINMNTVRMEIAIRNIIDNAIKYSGGKPVEVRIYKDNDSSICISVLDRGRGIEKEELENIFEPFYRIDKSRDKKIKGYGLGLSLVKKILNEHDWEIIVNSKSGEGSEFIIKIPSLYLNN